jgi:hypothetical protein
LEFQGKRGFKVKNNYSLGTKNYSILIHCPINENSSLIFIDVGKE